MEKQQVLGLDHLGIVVKDLEKAKWFFSKILDLDLEGSQEVLDEKVCVHFISLRKQDPKSPYCQPRFEFLESLEENSAIAKYKKKFGQGIHHLAFRIKNIAQMLEHLKENEIKIISDIPRKGASDSKIIFIHPQSTGGVLVELVEK